MQKHIWDIFKFVVSVLIGAFVVFIGVIKWKTGMDFRVSENEKDIRNIKDEKKDFVKIKDFDEMKLTLTKIQDKVFEIAKNMPHKR